MASVYPGEKRITVFRVAPGAGGLGMRNILGYFAITAFLVLCGVMALRYVRSGASPPPHTWSGGEITVGYSSEPPYSFRTQAGKITGAAPEMAKAALERAGIGPIHWVLLDFQQAIPALLDGRIDMVANGLFVTSERAKLVRFSRPYSQTLQGLLVKRGNPLALHSYEAAVENPTVRIAVLDGSVEQFMLVAMGTPESRLFVVPDPAGGLAAVRSGRTDCLALTEPSVVWLARESAGEAESARPFAQTPQFPPGRSAFAFRPSDMVLAGRVDAALAGFIGTTPYHDLLRLFGFGSEATPQENRQ